MIATRGKLGEQNLSTKGENMQAYVNNVKETLRLFDVVQIEQISWEHNLMTNTLARLTIAAMFESFGSTLIEYLRLPSIVV